MINKFESLKIMKNKNGDVLEATICSGIIKNLPNIMSAAFCIIFPPCCLF
jgi:hypothetical protein